MGRFATSWRMFKASWHVLWSRKELAIFPVLSGIASVLVTIAFAAGAVATSFTGGQPEASAYVFGVAYYLVSAYVVIFFNAALISQANIALSAGDPSVAGGLRAAGQAAGRILPWALLSATVSMILRALERRLGFLGDLLAGMLGMAWRLVTFLVLPVIVLEGAGTKDALRKSAQMFRGTWGENVIGTSGIGLFAFLLLLPSFGLVWLAVSAGGATALACVIIAVVWGLLVAITTAALSVIYQTALYRYAADGAAASAFGDVDLREAFRRR
jgi:Family of unknown function (DUF6159)